MKLPNTISRLKSNILKIEGTVNTCIQNTKRTYPHPQPKGVHPHQQTNCVRNAEGRLQAERTGDRYADPAKGAKNTGNSKFLDKSAKSSMKCTTQE